MDRISAGTTLRVHLTLRDQLLVSDDYPGWISRDDVVLESQAVEHFTKAIQAEPENIDWYVARAACYGRQRDFQNALADLEQTNAILPNRIDVVLVRAQIHAEQGDYEQALLDITAILEHHPNSAYGCLVLAQIHDRMGHRTEAIEAYRRCGQLVPDSARRVAAEALAHVKSADTHTGLQLLARAMRLNPFDPTAFYVRGFWRAAQEEYGVALADLNRAIALEPENASAQFLRASCHAALNHQTALSMRDVNEAIRLDDTNAAYFYFRAVLHQEQERWAECLEDLTRSFELKPDGGVERYTLRARALWKSGRLREGFADATLVWTKAPTAEAQANYEWYKSFALPIRQSDSWISRTLRGTAPAPSGELTPKAHDRVVIVNDDTPLRRGKQTIGHLQRGDVLRVQLIWQDRLLVSNGQPGWIDRKDAIRLPDAAEFFTRQIATDPQNAEFYSARASVHLDERHFDDALADIARTLALSPQNTAALVLRSKVWLEKQYYQAALEDAELVVAIDPENYAGHLARGRVRFALAHYREAVESFSRAAQLNPTSGIPLAERAFALVYLGDEPGYQRDAASSIKLDSYSGWAHAVRARAYRGGGDRYYATAEYNRAIALDPGLRTISALIDGLLRANDDAYTAIAAADADEAIELEPDNASAFLLRARVSDKQNDNEGFHQQVSKAIELDPTNAAARFNRSHVLARRGQFAAALVDAMAGVKCSPVPERKLLAWRGLMRLLSGDPKGALSDLPQFAEDRQDSSLKYFVIALAAVAARESSISNATIESMRKARISAQFCSLMSALAHLSQRDYAATILDCDAYLSTEEHHANSLFLRGIAKLQNGQPEEAVVDLDEALRLECSSPKTAQLARAQARAALGYTAETEVDDALVDAAVDAVVEALLDKIRERLMKEAEPTAARETESTSNRPALGAR